ncbi:MAG: Gfo/Idh/MocA family oxidoreductase [Planctomycetales bacterium]|nr:Gfo/Idh/MocA family oxidoreductase [Planctomycetales bacterium]
MSHSASRRKFLQTSTAALAAGALASGARDVHAAGSDTLKVGLIGCGGRGSGAAVNAMRADDNVKLTAMCDLFEDRLEQGKRLLGRQLAEKYAVTPEQSFSGFDGYKKLLATDVDVVVLATTPHFRPEHLEAAIKAGKHVFCEKPVAVDSTGVRRVLESVREAKRKNLSIVSGLCWRYDYGVRETVSRIKDGAIGDIRSIQENYLTGPLWHRGRNPEWTEMEYQQRNWMYFTWLSGDHIVEQHIHSLDKALWLMNDEPPVRAYGLGGRQVRHEEKWGHVYDHFSVVYEWANGVRCHAYTRQMPGCFNQTEDFVVGTAGTGKVLAHELANLAGEQTYKYKGDKPSMYDVEHKELFAGIRSGNIINNGEYMSYSTLMAIMGREVCYTGENLTWDEMMNSPMKLGPDSYTWGDVEVPQVAMPGTTKFPKAKA